MRILVTGASGQLGKTIREMHVDLDGLDMVFRTSAELDITNFAAVRKEFRSGAYSHCINCAAFTQVDLAENEKEKARLVNEVGAKNMAMACNENKTVLVHVSTDFVFDGKRNTPYGETDSASPLGHYGHTKFKGELSIGEHLAEHFIIRTSWLYSEYGNNFMKTMIRLGKEREELGVVYDQIGTPTYTKDLAKALFRIIRSQQTDYGIYHYSNEGVASWYDFTKEIFDGYGLTTELLPILSEAYPTPAERPKYSVLDKSKIKSVFNLRIPHWKDSLHKALVAHAATS